MRAVAGEAGDISNGVAVAAVLIAAIVVLSTSAGADSAAHCHVRGLLPDPVCTPGSVETADLDVICHQTTRERRDVDEVTKERVFAEYGLSPKQPRGAYEVDHLIPLCAGGSNDPSNLWPEAAPGFHEKDRLEDEVCREICAGKLTRSEAVPLIAADWTAEYAKIFGEGVPR